MDRMDLIHRLTTGAVDSCVYCGELVEQRKRYCTKCGNRNHNWKEPDGIRCVNCFHEMRKEDKYCRICGGREKEGFYRPQRDVMACLYGPRPEKREHVCVKCGYGWTTILMVDNEKFCPECGGEAPLIRNYRA